MTHYQAPRAHGSILAVPPIANVGNLVDANRSTFSRSSVSLLGRQLHELRQEARAALLTAAAAYLEQAGEPIPIITHPDSLVMAGHQPDLFHPGVWIKNFALNRLARSQRATPINLIVDSDTVKSTAIKLPHWDAKPERVHRASVPFDRWEEETPYEERPVLDDRLFATLPMTAREHVAGWPFRPMLEDFWNDVTAQAGRTSNLGERLTAGRRSWERRWGCHNLEVPLHAVCTTAPFAWFACHVLAELPRFHAIYNDCLHAYRCEHGIRSRAHPVPDLGAADGWLETPFFAWRAGARRRGRLLAKLDSAGISLRIHNEPGPTLPLGPPSVAAWLDLERQGWKVRSRALTTTMVARLLLADLFIHGIGGAKYDELTDAIMRRFFGIEPPGFLVLSATLHLPFNDFPSTFESCRQLHQQVRDVHWNPQRHIDASGDPAVRALIAEKLALIGRQPTDSAGRKARFLELQSITRQLRKHLGAAGQTLTDRLARCRHEVEANAVLRNREYAFCLYPEAMLRDFYQRLF